MRKLRGAVCSSVSSIPMRLSFALALALALLWIGCRSPTPMTTDAIPMPPLGEVGRFNGGYETRTSQVRGLVRDDLGDDYGPIQFEDRYEMLLGAEAAWPEIEAFYDSAFARPPLDAFVRQPAVSPHPDRYHVAVWSDGNEALGVAMVLGGPEDPLQFLFLFGTLLPEEGNALQRRLQASG